MRSLSLKAYQALARNVSANAWHTDTKRPEGDLLMAIVETAQDALAMTYLAERLSALREPVHLLLVGAKSSRPKFAAHLLWADAPQENPDQIEPFLNHWKPDVCIWYGGPLDPLFISSIENRGLAMLLLGARTDQLDKSLWRWIPSIARQTLNAFDDITAQSEDAARMIRKWIGSRQYAIDVAAPLQISSAPLPVDDTTLTDVNEWVAGRPIWLAARVHEMELQDILGTHRELTKLTHRLLLVLVCDGFPSAMKARQLLAKQGWRCAHWEDGDIVDESTQILLVEETAEMGLWFRISPVSFLGNSLFSGMPGCDPYEAAALGSAVLYGPNVSAHLASYSRLAAAGAARIVRDMTGLKTAVSHVIAPDQAAHMAAAAWQVISEGAEATDHAAETIMEILDTRQVSS